MSSKRVETILLCEDRQHEAFLRRLIEQVSPGGKRPRVLMSPKGRGAAEGWVIQRFPAELRALRRGHSSARLVAMVDGDGGSHDSRAAQMAKACLAAEVDPPGPGEQALLLVPCRNIETWIAYLRGEAVDEEASYPKLKRESDCQPQVAVLAEMCQLRQLRSPAPPALESACVSYQRSLRR